MANEHDDAFGGLPNISDGQQRQPAQPVAEQRRASVPDKAVPVARKVKKRSFLGGVFKSIFLTVFILSLLLNLYLAVIVLNGLQEREYLPGDSAEKIALIEVAGTSDMDTAQQFRSMLRRA